MVSIVLMLVNEEPNEGSECSSVVLERILIEGKDGGAVDVMRKSGLTRSWKVNGVRQRGHGNTRLGCPLREN